MIAKSAALATTVRRAREPPQQVTPVENEYIQLLQQQIFFLELKLNILKKNDPFQGAPLEGPLEDVVAQLRGKYATMESAFKKELEVLQSLLPLCLLLYQSLTPSPVPLHSVVGIES
jgi:hypothetical protein